MSMNSASQETILIYSAQKNERLNFIVHHIFEFSWGIKTRLTDNWSDFNSFEGAKLNYSSFQSDTGGVHIHPTWILFEDSLPERPHFSGVGEQVKLFAYDNESDFDFDPLAALFYALSLAEEYFPQEKDKHGRNQAKNNWFFQEGWQEIPLVEIWMEQLWNVIISKYPSLQRLEQKYQWIPTFDVDSAFRYKGKGWKRRLGGSLRALKGRDWKELLDRFCVLCGLKCDPFDVFAWLTSILSDKNQSRFFIQIGDYGVYDKNTLWKNKKFQKIVRELDQQFIVGLHPSYSSNDSTSVLEMEKERLEKVIQHPVKSSRQHFLKLSFPETYKALLDGGIREDFTFGFAEKTGFRSLTCRPFYYFDLSKNQQTDLKIIPLSAMDVTLREYMKLTPIQAIEKLSELIDVHKKYKGTFVTLWHNPSFTDLEGWKGWKDVFLSLLKYPKH